MFEELVYISEEEFMEEYNKKELSWVKFIKILYQRIYII
jgi:hypothetical protein